MSSGKISEQQVAALKTKVEAEEKRFFKELYEEGQWLPCGEKENAKLFYRDDPDTGIKKFKIDARVPTRLQDVLDALFIEKNRVGWEPLIDGMKTIEDFGENHTMHHITTKSIAMVVGRRDFVHFRRIRGPDGIDKKENQTDARVVVDISTEHPDYPANTWTFTRGTTLFSATIFREYCIDGKYSVTYESITQSNINGYVPGWLINMVTTSSTIEWYNSMEGCAIDLMKKREKK